MQRLTVNQPLNYEFTRHLEPRVRIESGTSLIVEAEDALSGQIRTDNDRRDKTKIPQGNPVTGPIYVEGAAPGDHLAVEIHKIEPWIDQCATRTADPHQLCEWLGSDVPHGTHVCEIADGFIHWSDKIKIPYQPMLGCIGTAPDWGVPTCGPAGPHGGNMDIIETCPGNTVYLPVFIPGGYLYLGDAHANMGHGELSATGLEMPSVTTITVKLVKAKTIPGPRIESPNEIMAIATGCPMERAIAQAMSYLILWMESDYGWNRWRAYDILTHVAKISVGYYGIGTVACKIEKKYLNNPS
ncbi:MAG: acetamidase/formamidase family protein [Planctomycetaceae bacterium]